jgi:hypothetical protein
MVEYLPLGILEYKYTPAIFQFPFPVDFCRLRRSEFSVAAVLMIKVTQTI